jgi:hypothetical protein
MYVLGLVIQWPKYAAVTVLCNSCTAGKRRRKIFAWRLLFYNLRNIVFRMLGNLIFLITSCYFSLSFASPYDEGAWRTSLDSPGSCWTERSCSRVMSTAHGGEWNLTFPYDSMPSFNKAYEDGADAIKGGIFLLIVIYLRYVFTYTTYGVTRFQSFER